MSTEETTTEAMNNPVRISRIFGAPWASVWRASPEREHLMKRFDPKEFKMAIARLEFRPAGLFPGLERIL